jgi:hypothetical protein
MEKYGVDVDPATAKTAGEKNSPTCPSCGDRLLPNTNVPTCPRCGTKAFEPSE